MPHPDHGEPAETTVDRRLKPLDASKKLFSQGEKANFSVQGMYCPGCAEEAERVLREDSGVEDAEINFASERGWVRYDPDQGDPETALHNLEGLGYKAHILGDRRERKAERQQENLLLQLITAAAFGMQVMLLYLVQLYPQYAAGNYADPDVLKIQYLVWALTTPALFYGGISFLRGAWKALLARTATMNTLVALGTLSAYSYSVYVTLTGGGEAYFDSVVMITTFIMLGRYLEKMGGAQARKDIRHLLKLQPDRAWRREDDEWHQVPAAKLAAGDTILVKPGERVPADARVVENEAAADEALLTGESRPVEKEQGDPVYAGTIVTDNALVCEVTEPPGGTRLAHITHVVEETLNTKPPIQRLADRVARYFALGIVTVAILTFLGWWITGTPPSQALLTGVAVLVVACPCALGLATPLALAIALGRTSRAGILVRNPVALETAATVERIVFDKTGALTQGKLTLTETAVAPDAGLSAEELICLAAAVEQYSEHPVARAIVAGCEGPLPEAKDFQAVRGAGASAQVEGDVQERVKVGSASFLDVGEGTSLLDQAKERAGQGETVVWVRRGETLAGFITLRDEPNPTASQALEKLQADDIRLSMLSGDSPRTTRAIAGELGLSDFQGDASPTKKAEHIKDWQDDGEQVAMVGDGVNDAPALAQADLSITTASGTDVAGETSDVVLMRSDLTLVPWLVDLSRRTRRIIRQNLGWAFAYNVVAVPLAAFGIINPIIAAAAMATSSLLVVGNSLRLRR